MTLIHWGSTKLAHVFAFILPTRKFGRLMRSCIKPHTLCGSPFRWHDAWRLKSGGVHNFPAVPLRTDANYKTPTATIQRFRVCLLSVPANVCLWLDVDMSGFL